MKAMEMQEFKFCPREFPKETFIGNRYDRSEESSSRLDEECIDNITLVTF